MSILMDLAALNTIIGLVTLTKVMDDMAAFTVSPYHMMLLLCLPLPLFSLTW